MKQEEQSGRSDGEVVEWVNKAVRDPMVELDPVTVFRRIVAERRAIASASLAMARAKEEAANLALETTSPPPFILGSKWPGKSIIAIATALVLLAVAAALYFLRSRKDRCEAMESSINGRRKLVKDRHKAPAESVLTAMALGAASVSRTKGHVGSTHDTLHASNGNVVESQRPHGAIEFYPIVNAGVLEDVESDFLGKPTFGQMPYSSSIVEEFTPLKDNNVRVDVTEGPWFGQGVNDTEMLAPVEEEELESGKSEVEELEGEELPLSNETTALPAVEQLLSEVSAGEIDFEAPVSTGVVDGEFHGEVVAVAGQLQVVDFKFESSQIDGVLAGVLAGSSRTSEELEQIIKEDWITSSEVKGALDDTVCPDQDIVIDSSALNLANGQFDETSSESDVDNSKDHGVEQSFTPTQDDVTYFEASGSKSGFEEVQVEEGYLLVLNSNSQSGQVVEDEGFVSDTGKEFLTDISASLDPIDGQNLDPVASCSSVDAPVQASEEDSREDSKKALQAAMPAIAIGVGTVGALFGVAGGLQVVGFAALASFISHDFFWAQSRESLWQELNGITDRRKLLEFLAKRNIMRMEQEKSNL